MIDTAQLQLFDSRISTSVGQGTGSGGNITITASAAASLNQSEIRANADEGAGGNIELTANPLLRSSDSLLTASSRLGVDGTIRVSNSEDLSSQLLRDESDFLQNNIDLQQCEPVRALQHLSRYQQKLIPEGMGKLPENFLE